MTHMGSLTCFQGPDFENTHKGLAPPQKLKQYLHVGKEKHPKKKYAETAKQS